MRSKILPAAALLGAFLAPALTAAAAVVTTGPSIVNGSLNIFRDFRGANDVGIAQGDVFQFGGDIVGGSAADNLSATFVPDPGNTGTPGFSTTSGPCGALITDANFCARSTTFTTGRTSGTWTGNFQSATGSTILTLPDTRVIPPTPVAFPHSVTITPGSTGTTPTISWSLPAGTAPNAFRINIYDKSQLVPRTTEANVIYTANLDPTTTQFTIPATLPNSQSLQPGGNYVINFQLINTRDGMALPVTNSQADILTRSSSFFDFSPPKAGSPPVIQLPTIDPAGVYHFSFTISTPSQTTFIDPTIAIGYNYATGAGDPNFASVTLPVLGNNIYDLTFLGSAGLVDTKLNGGSQFFFPSGGLSAFSVNGIDPSDMLDPSNSQAFVTGLTFVSAGDFSGTMTPVTTVVAAPEPATISIMVGGLVGLAMRRRRRPFRRQQALVRPVHLCDCSRSGA